MSRWAWCLVKDDETLATGWNKIGDYWYYLDKNGVMVTGWYQDITNSKYYYLDDNGRMQIGWIKDNEKWYYLGSDGAMYVSGSYTIDDKNYSFDSTGAMQETGLSDNGAKFIGSWEGLYTTAYEDPYYPGNQSWWTIGYGTTYAVTPSAFPNGLASTCTEEQAVSWLKEEAANCVTSIKDALSSAGVTLTTNELDACISFAYNCGVSALLGSTFWKNVIAGVRDADTIIANLQAWSKANGITSTGLLKRRNSEAALFLNADYTGNI